ncbi:Outer envelope pore protein 16-2, chloroplastic, partial [Mucuna pruriens]
MNSSSNLETRSLLDEVSCFNKGGLFNLGHPLLNRIAETFVKAAGIGAVQAVSREAYLLAVEGAIYASPTISFSANHHYECTQRNGTRLDNTGCMPSEVSGAKKHCLHGLGGETCSKSLEAMVKNIGKESFQWGLAAGIYSGLTYGLKETRGAHDLKNSAVAGAITGATLAITSGDSSHENMVQCAITGAASPPRQIF